VKDLRDSSVADPLRMTDISSVSCFMFHDLYIEYRSRDRDETEGKNRHADADGGVNEVAISQAQFLFVSRRGDVEIRRAQAGQHGQQSHNPRKPGKQSENDRDQTAIPAGFDRMIKELVAEHTAGGCARRRRRIIAQRRVYLAQSGWARSTTGWRNRAVARILAITCLRITRLP